MTAEEFSNEFDVLASSYRRFKASDDQETLDSIEFNEYEKSVFLTKAQEEFVKELYSGKYTGYSFEKTEEIRRQLLALVNQYSWLDHTTDVENSLLPDIDLYKHFVYKLSDAKDCWYIVYEQASLSSESDSCINGRIVDVVPVTHDEYQRIKNNPFRGPNTRRVLRLDNKEGYIELVSKYTIEDYTIRYIKRPEPIVLEKFPEESINGISTVLTCKLSESLHRDILERAVQLALASKGYTSNKDKG